eukprot:3468615-Pyramimonas_sp.AAC.1
MYTEETGNKRERIIERERENVIGNEGRQFALAQVGMVLGILDSGQDYVFVIIANAERFGKVRLRVGGGRGGIILRGRE